MVLVPGGLLAIELRYTYLQQRCLTRQLYQMQGAAFVTADPIQVAEAYWDNIKTLWRSMFSTASIVNTLDSVFVREIGNAEQYAEYAVPSGETVGTRAAGNDGEWLPSFVVAAVKLTVGSSVTRPGQKRLVPLRRGDVTDNLLATAQKTLVDNVAAIFSTDRNLGAPVATGILSPVIGGTVIDGDPTVFQFVTGKVTSSFVSSQISRKIGHGS